MKISVIGAGIGGLSVACLLASKGHHVSVFEKNSRVGGKMNLIEAEGFRFDTGPSLLTMPHVLNKLFQVCGTKLEDHLELIPLDPLCRYFYKDGTVFDSYADRAKSMEEISTFSDSESKAYSEFLDHSSKLYEKTADAFIFNPLFDLNDLKELDLLSFFGIDAFTNVSKRVDSYFKSEYLRKFFKRFTTYNGSNPWVAPATLNVIPHVELDQGGYYVKGGLYKIAETLFWLAGSLGVEFQFNAEVQRIETNDHTVTGIHSNDEFYPADLVVSNSDSTETILHLLPDSVISGSKKTKQSNIEPSCSGFVLLLGLNNKYEELSHHNIFFSGDYEQEFNQIFSNKVMPDDPTIYVANTSHTDPKHAPKEGSNLFVLINAPYLSDSYNWKKEAEQYELKVITELEKRGLNDLRDHIVFKERITPVDFYDKYRSNKGSIYGTSSNSRMSAFLRPRNKSREIDGLYFVGGSTHPGGGIPLVVQSAFNALELIERYEFTD